MLKIFVTICVLYIIGDLTVSGCLIVNCPRGGKRSGRLNSIEGNLVKPCVSCGPGMTGQCFGENICCGRFGCLIGTQETFICQREGNFRESEPCVAGRYFCNKKRGRCAAGGICCDQESCHTDKNCVVGEKIKISDMAPLDFYNLFAYPNANEYSNE